MATRTKTVTRKRAVKKRKPLLQVLGRKGMKRPGIDMLKYCGSITITVDPIAYQRESRGDE